MKLNTLFVVVCALFLVAGCSSTEAPVQEEIEPEPLDPLTIFFDSLENVSTCLDYSESDAFNATTLADHIDHAQNNTIMLYRDACIIHLVDEDVSDESITYCDNATKNIYQFREDANHTYAVTGQEFCFRNAFDELRFAPAPPSLGDIRNKTTCDVLSTGKDNCLWVVAMNGDLSACMRMSSFENMQHCRRTHELPQIIAEAEAALNITNSSSK